MLYCPKCSFEHPEDKKFCKNCGSPLVVREPESPLKDKTIGTLEATMEVKNVIVWGKYCSVCRVEYPPDKKFCKVCGGALTEKQATQSKAETGPASIQRPQASQTSPPDIEKPLETKQKKYCPSCGTEQGFDQRFCKNCGFALSAKMENEPLRKTTPMPSPDPKLTSPSPKPTVAPGLGVPSLSKVSSLLRKKKKLSKMGGKVTILITNLGAQRGVISDNALNTTIKPYEMKLEGIEKEIKEIDRFLNELQKNMETESENLEREIQPYQNRLDELKAMRKAKGLTSGDYKRFKKEPFRTFRQLGSQIKKRQKLLRILTSPGSRTGLMFDSSVYLKIGVLVGAIAILGAGGFFGYKFLFKKDKDVNVSVTQLGRPQGPSSPSPSVSTASSEGEIKKIFDTIKQANMTEDINLFMTCYSTAFPNLEEKKEKTIQTWKDMDITGLAYTMRDLIVQQNTTEVTIDWQITTRAADSGQTETFNTTNNVVLQKEGDQWKIVNLK